MAEQRFKTHGKKRNLLQPFLLLLIVAFLAAAGFASMTLFERGAPVITMDEIPEYIGADTTLELTIADAKSGIRSIHMAINQENQNKEVLHTDYPRQGYMGKAGPTEIKEKQLIDIKKLGLKEGPAEIILEVRDYSFWGLFQGNLTRIAKNITIDTKAPKINLLHATRYLKQGGAGIVIYQTTEDAMHHGVQINGNFHPGFPLNDGREHTYIAFIALPYDATAIVDAKITAEDLAGNKTATGFSSTYKKANQRHDDINISDGFLSAKIPEFEEHYPEMKGDMIEKYLYTNRDLRDINNKKIHDLCQNPSPERFWKGTFQRMPGSPRAGFADHRTYFYNGQPIDEQVHLGVDIASTQRADVRAAEAGKVVFTGYNGIYGEMVVLDHGQGIFSLYSHLSQINVTMDSQVDQNTVLGLTGTTGMAGGDHLHFSMLINGVFVNPVEWWDPHWIAVTIDGPVAESKFN
ncbi:MAG: M23 family metallopeptidase [Proteobacteria bacterium]|nr:M23 family metallopeptidase [Pseudomonadota bacterium]MBU1650141.1 M23 family metallopeptidase [Pseudomonadota bacterium]